MAEDVGAARSSGSPGDGVPLHRRPRVRRAVVVLVIVYVAFGLAWSIVDATMTSGWRGLVATVTLGLLAASCCLLALLRRDPDHNALLLAAAVVAAVIVHRLHPYSGAAVLFTVAWISPFRTKLWQTAGIVAAGIAGFVAASVSTGLPGDDVFGMSVGVASSALFAVVVHQLILTWEQTAAATRARSREAVLAERTHLAREVHDILAHSLSAQIVHLEGAQLLLEQRGDHAQALDRVTRAGRLARAGLEETRRALETLRGHDPPLVDHLEHLATDFRTATGARCRVTTAGDPARLAPEARLAVARTAQEALTNVRKHAHGADVTLALRCGDQWCELDVRDTGGASGDLGDAGGGYGLIGMRERAELLGGSLDARVDGTGFRVLLRVPA